MRTFVDYQALDLVEHRRMRLVAIAAIGAPGNDDADRRLLRQHGAHLHRRSMRAQQKPAAIRLRIEEKRVVHRPRRMLFRKVELGEIVIVGLDVGTFGDRKPHIGEDRGEFVDDLGDRMNASDLRRRFAYRQGYVDALGIEPRLERRRLESLAPLGERGVHPILHTVDERTLAFALLRRQSAERFQERGDRAVFAQRRNADHFERGIVSRAGNVGENFVFELRQIGHRSLRHERQIGIGWPAAGLSQHAMDLAAMMSLMIEHMGD
jgi:hypothetical protein